MAQVQSIGGVFIDSNDAAALVDWYGRMFGIEFEGHPQENSYYKVFQTRDLNDSTIVRENPVLAIVHKEKPLATSGRGFVLNLRVDNLDEMIDFLRTQNVRIEEKRIEWAGGKHAWVYDLDGNRIELYEEIIINSH
jgi:catechol 2,3-dioxygenase-like lactoylglutathione lyase family enzyme